MTFAEKIKIKTKKKRDTNLLNIGVVSFTAFNILKRVETWDALVFFRITMTSKMKKKLTKVVSEKMEYKWLIKNYIGNIRDTFKKG